MIKLTVEQLENIGWIKVDHPSAEGQSLVKGKYRCQFLTWNNINGLNADIPDPNFTIIQKETYSVLFLGKINTLDDFKYLCNLLNIKNEIKET